MIRGGTVSDSGVSTEELLLALARVRSFSHLGKEKLKLLVELGEYREFSQGSTILSEGEENQDLFFLLKGTVSVYSGGKFICRYGRAGDLFGEMSVVSEGVVSATVVTNDNVEALVFDGNIVGGFKSSNEHELVTVFYKLFSLSLLEKLRLTTLKARMFEEAIRHAPLRAVTETDPIFGKSVEKQLNDTLLTALAVHTAEQAIVVADPEGRIVRFNLAAESLFSVIELQIAGKPLQTLCEEHSYQKIFPSLLEGKISSWSGELIFLRRDGWPFPARTSISTIQDLEGNQIGLLSIITDISKEKNLEEQLRQSQKMEAIGQLAGGIAHDFNNLLQIISGCAELAQINMEKPEKLTRDLNAVLDAAKRGSSLTNRLLTFSRKRPLAKQIISLNDVVTNIGQMLPRVIGPNIQLVILLEENLWAVRADSDNLGQAMTNICLNARDAMPSGGKMTIQTRNMEIDEAFCDTNLWANPGQYVLLSVADSGEGMDPKQVKRIFEPFFTTKEVGQGTGLGLSIVMDIVKNKGGFLHVDSELGAGSTFNIYIPRTESTPLQEIEELPIGHSGFPEGLSAVNDGSMEE